MRRNKYLLTGAALLLLAGCGTAWAADVKVKYSGPAGQGDIIYYAPSTGTTNLRFTVNGLSNVTVCGAISLTDLVPAADDSSDIGTSALEWKDAYIDGILYVDSISNSAAILVLQALSTVGILPTADDTSDLGSASKEWKDAYIDGLLNVDSITNSAAILVLQALSTVGILPTADDTSDLGSASKEWKDVYVDGVLYVDSISNAADIIMLKPVAALTVTGDITANGNVVGDGSTKVTNMASVYATAAVVSTVTASGDITANGNVVGDGSTVVTNCASAYVTQFIGGGAGLTGIVPGGIALASNKVIIGNAAGVGAAVTLSGDLVTATDGTVTFADNAVPASEVGPGTLPTDVVYSNATGTVTASNAVFNGSASAAAMTVGTNNVVTGPYGAAWRMEFGTATLNSGGVVTQAWTKAFATTCFPVVCYAEAVTNGSSHVATIEAGLASGVFTGQVSKAIYYYVGGY